MDFHSAVRIGDVTIAGGAVDGGISVFVAGASDDSQSGRERGSIRRVLSIPPVGKDAAAIDRQRAKAK
jgi:hypothetical protein